jgi:D-arabinose 1-dehydrogenase
MRKIRKNRSGFRLFPCHCPCIRPAQSAAFEHDLPRYRTSILVGHQSCRLRSLSQVYVHDVEFVVENKRPRTDGNPLGALGPEKDAYGLAEGQEGTILSDGDRQLLGAVAELRKMKTEGLIRTVGISGYPLPTLMRLALLVLHSTGEPLDVLLSYSHLNLQNATLIPFAQALRERARVGQILAASPWSMGLLTPSPPPPWHPAPPALTEVTRVGLRLHADFAGGLPNVALGYAYRIAGEHDLPFVAGFSSLAEVHASVKGWREIQGVEDPERIRREQEARKLFEDAGYLDWSWTSPV